MKFRFPGEEKSFSLFKKRQNYPTQFQGKKDSNKKRRSGERKENRRVECAWPWKVLLLICLCQVDVFASISLSSFGEKLNLGFSTYWTPRKIRLEKGEKVKKVRRLIFNFHGSIKAMKVVNLFNLVWSGFH